MEFVRDCPIDACKNGYDSGYDLDGATNVVCYDKVKNTCTCDKECVEKAHMAQCVQTRVLAPNAPAGTENKPIGVTRERLVDMIPQRARLVRLDVPGSVLYEAITQSLRAHVGGLEAGLAGDFLQSSSGLGYEWFVANGVPTVAYVYGVDAAGARTLIDNGDGDGDGEAGALVSVVTTVSVAKGSLFRGVFGRYPATDLGTLYSAVESYLATTMSSPLRLPPQLASDPQTLVTQLADQVTVEVGALCRETEGLGREPCDHLYAAVNAINDKKDGFLTRLLPNTKIVLKRAKVGCADANVTDARAAQAGPSLVDGALAGLFAQLPRMAVVIGPPCDRDLQRASEYMQANGKQTTIISPLSATAALADDARHPNLVSGAAVEYRPDGGCSLILFAFATLTRTPTPHGAGVWAGVWRSKQK